MHRNEFITKSYVQTLLLLYIIARKIQAFVILVEEFFNPHVEEHCHRWCEMGLNVLKLVIGLKALT